MAGALNLLLIGFVLQGALCGDFQVTIPRSIKTLSGSCVTIPCSFDIENSHEKYFDKTCKAIWRTNDKEVFDSTEQTGTNGELLGELTEKNCTTTLKSITAGKYFFRLDCDHLKYSFDKENQVVEISILAKPPTPTLTPSTLEVKEGTSVSLKCSASAPCLSHPPTLTWTLSLGDSQETLQEDQGKAKVMTSVLTFTASHLHHGKTIACTATYKKQDGVESATGEDLTLNISFAPKILFTSDCTITAAQLNCSCETVGNPAPILQWYLQGLPVNHSDMFAISNKLLNDTSRRSIITVDQQQEDLSILLCRSSSSLGSVAQRFYVYSFRRPKTGEECKPQEMLLVFVIIIGVLAAALVCALLFAIRAQRRTSDTGTAVTSRSLTSERENEVSIRPEEDIYVNTNAIRNSDKRNTHLEHQQFASKSSERKNEEGSDVVYSSVLLKSKKKKGGERSWDMDLPGSSYPEEERCVAGGRSRNHVSSAVEMDCLYGNIATG